MGLDIYCFMGLPDNTPYLNALSSFGSPSGMSQKEKVKFHFDSDLKRLLGMVLVSMFGCISASMFSQYVRPVCSASMFDQYVRPECLLTCSTSIFSHHVW